MSPDYPKNEVDKVVRELELERERVIQEQEREREIELHPSGPKPLTKKKTEEENDGIFVQCTVDGKTYINIRGEFPS